MSTTRKWRQAAKAGANALFALGVLVFIVLPDNKYDWMHQLAPLATLPPDQTSGERMIFTALLLAAIIASQLAVAATAERRREKLWATALIVVAIALWATRLWR